MSASSSSSSMRWRTPTPASRRAQKTRNDSLLQWASSTRAISGLGSGIVPALPADMSKPTAVGHEVSPRAFIRFAAQDYAKSGTGIDTTEAAALHKKIENLPGSEKSKQRFARKLAERFEDKFDPGAREVLLKGRQLVP